MVASAELKSILNHQDFEKWRFPEMGKRCPQIVHFKKGASMKTIHFFGYHHDGNSGTCGFGCSKGECGTGITMARNLPPRVPRVFSSERPEMLRLLPGNKSEVNPIIKCYNWFKIEYSPEKRKKTIWIEQKHIGMIYWIYILLLRCFLFQRIGCASRFPKLFLSVSWPNFSSP